MEMLHNLKARFNTPYQQYKEREGQECEFVQVICSPTPDIDEECLPMFKMRFPDGKTLDVWPEELTFI